MRAMFVIALSLALSGTAMAQSQNVAKTGVGNPLDTLEALQAEMNKHWDGRPGQVLKGAVGLAGVAAALSVASDAVNFKLRIRGDGSVDQGSSNSTNNAVSVSTATTTSTSTSTN